MAATTTNEMNFDDITPVEIPVSIAGEKYVLCEATGEAGRQFNNARTRGIKFGVEGKPNSIEGVANVEPLLVSLCLFKILAEGMRKPVSVSVISAWPYRVMKRLFDKAKEISDLEEKEEDLEELQKQRAEIDKKIADIGEDAAKNSPSDTRDGSD